ncbi:MAG: S49 family peptidase, partial [Bacteroidales bacterium]|nr:S49 family peptidase [Bacteroidales bacterium]
PTERLVLQKMIDETYNTFVNRVSEGRNMLYLNVDKIGEGRVWSGVNAKENGLVDVLGGLTEAVAIAAEKAGLEQYRLVELPKLEDPLTQVMNELSGNVRDRLIRRELSGYYSQYLNIRALLQSDRIQARMPFEILVH